MAARQALRKKVERVLTRVVRRRLGNGASVRVEESDYRRYVHVYVSSSKFSGLSPDARSAKVWEWLEDDLTPAEQAWVTILMTLTPQEERQLLGGSKAGA